MVNNHVRPINRKLTDTDIRNLISDAMVTGECHALGPAKVAAAAGGVDEKTIRRARDREHTPHAATIFNLLDADPHILDAILAAKGFMLTPLMDSAPDIISSAGAAIHRIGMNRCERSDGGTAETDRELILTEAENDALLAACLERRSRIATAKLRRAAA